MTLSEVFIFRSLSRQEVVSSGVCLFRSLSFQEVVFQEFVFQEFVIAPFTPSDCEDIKIRKCEFVAKTQFLWISQTKSSKIA